MHEDPTPEQFARMPAEQQNIAIYSKLTRLDPIVSSYDSFLFGRKIAVGLIGIATTVATVGGMLLWGFNHIRFK